MPCLCGILVSIFLVSEANASNVQCQEALLTWVRTFFLPANVAQENYSKMVRYSGKSINDLGLYYECLEVSEAKYVIFQINESPALVVGLCLPSICTIENYWNVVHGNFTSDFSNYLSRQLESHSAIFTLKSPQSLHRPSRRLLGESIQKIVFPQDFEKSASDMSLGGALLLLFLGLLFLISISATLFELMLLSRAPHSRRGSTDSIAAPERYSHLNYDPEKLFQHSFVDFQSPSRSRFESALLCFSLYTNTLRLLNIRQIRTSSTLDCLNAVKVLSIFWVCFGHTELFRAENSVVLNIDEVPEFYSHLYFSLISSAPYAVDSFFWASGLLQGYLLVVYFRSREEYRFGLLVMHRLVRVLPMYVCVLLMSWTLARYIGSGPKWYNADEIMHRDCQEYFWTYVAFVNNFAMPSDSNNCLVGSWYLPNDMQFYLLSIPIVYLYARHSRIYGWILFTIGILFSVVASGTIAYDEHFEINAFTQNNNQYMRDLYYKPYCRIAPYCIGALGGFVYYSQQQKSGTGDIFDALAEYIRMSIEKLSVLRWSLYFLGFLLINLAIWLQYGAYQSKTSWNRQENAAFIAVQRLMWSLGLNFFFLPVLLGRGSVLRPFLKSNYWNITAKLVFGVYLLHMVVGQIYFFSQPITYYYTQANLLKDSVFILVLSFCLVVPLVLLVESPCINLEKLLTIRE